MLATLFFHLALVAIILAFSAMVHVERVKQILCMEQKTAKDLYHGFVRIFSRKHPLMTVIHPLEQK